MSKHYYTIPELEDLFGISDTTLIRLIQRGEIQNAFKLGRKWLVPVPEIERIAGKLDEISALENSE